MYYIYNPYNLNIIITFYQYEANIYRETCQIVMGRSLPF